MADDQPKPASANTDAQADPLAAELMSMGSFGDAPGGAGDNAPATNTATATASADEAVTPDMAELEALLKQAGFDDPTGGTANGAQDDLAGQLLAEARAASASQSAPPKPLPATVPFDLPAFQQVLSDSQASSIDLLRDVELNVKIELGRSRMLVEDVLKLNEGAVVELDKLAGDPVDVYVNDRLVARGEVLVLNDNFCVRVNEIVASLKDEG